MSVSLTEEQQAAAFLRERYLQLIASFSADKLCKINMHNGIEVYANIRAFDSSSDNILVENLQPPSQKFYKR
ncbi:hypothetical protein GWI33_007412 [Rhynchophorus ferrugineus]|uniref:Gem-associated protein 7 n=1 Tax=Rhynchophorus ferrugineus TaxID=354439 RepID=A0A834IHP9_RHYFE|nr:hypothetical protein GWI33_007412 [Rhynchophorus ferrugineus]